MTKKAFDMLWGGELKTKVQKFSLPENPDTYNEHERKKRCFSERRVFGLSR